MYYNRTRGRGFSLVELLVVIAIIGLLATLAFLSLNSARRKARDAHRISDIRQLQSVLELYYSDQTTPSYPPMPDNANGDVEQLLVASDSSSTENPTIPLRYITAVPAAPTPPDNPPGLTPCSLSATTTGDFYNTALVGNTYRYMAYADTDASVACKGAATACMWYTYRFCLGGASGGLSAGEHVAIPSGFQ